MRRGADEQGVAQVLSLLVAAGVFLGTLGTLLVHTSSTGAVDHTSLQGVRQAEVEALADLLVGSPGSGWDFENGTVDRMGLHDGHRALDVQRMSLLRGAAYDAQAANHLVDYEEARASLGLDAATGRDFHLRVSPIGLPKIVKDLDLSGTRTAYIGPWNGLPAEVLPDGDDATVAQRARQETDAGMDHLAAQERQMLTDLGLGFQDRTHLDAVQWDLHVGDLHITERLPASLLDGDVYPDTKGLLDATLPGRIGQYDLLVVGSEARHNSLTSEVVKVAVRDWVLEGGTLLVLGSGSQSTQWLQPLFHVGTATVNGGAYAADADHPMLREPHELAWQEYDVPERAWDIKSQGSQAAEDDFNHALTSGDGSLLSVSRSGAFGQGRILLSAYQPGAIASSHGVAEAQGLLHNLIVHMDRSHLYLEYGASVPSGALVANTTRLGVLVDPELGPVPVRVHLFLW